MATRVSSLPSVPRGLDTQSTAFLQALKEFVETRSGQRRGSESARYITKGELDQGLGVDITSQALDLSAQIPSTEIPDPPTDMTVENRMWSNLLSWTNPESASVSHIEVWAAEDSQSRDDALLIGYKTVHNPQRGERAEWMHSALNVRLPYTYWIRSVTHSGVYSVWCPPDAQGGYVVEASMSVSMEEVMADLTGSITENELATDLNSRIDLIDTDAPFFESGVFEAGVISPLGWYISDMGVVTTDHEARIGAVETTSGSLANTIDGLQQEVLTLTTNIFDPDTYYQVGAYSNYNGLLYRCHTAVTSIPTPTPDNDPDHWLLAPDTVTLYNTISDRVDTIEGEVETKVEQATYDVLAATVSGHGTSITQNAENIALKASQTDVDTLSDQVASHTSSITQNAESISLTTTAIIGTQAFAEGVADSGVCVQSIDDVQPIDSTISRVSLELDAADARLTAAVAQVETELDEVAGTLTASIQDAMVDISATDGIVAQHTSRLDSLDTTTDEQTTRLDAAFVRIDAEEGISLSHTRTLQEHGESIEAHGSRLTVNESGISMISQSIVGTPAFLEEVAEAGVVVRSVDEIDPVDAHISQVSLDLDTVETTITARVSDLEVDLDEVNNTLTQSLADASLEISAHDGILAQHQTSLETLDQSTGLLESRLDQVYFQMTSSAGIVAQHSSQIETAQGDIVSQAAELALASDRFTVKIQKDENGKYYAAGFGLIVYPQWRAGGVYESGKTVYNNGGSYSSKIDNNTGHEPTGEDAYWAVVDDEEAPESEFIIQADKLMVIEPGETAKAMLTLGTVDGVNTLAINGALIADEGIQTRMLAAGLVTADKVSAEDVFTMNLQSGNYSSGSSGFKIDAKNGTAEFNNISLRISNPATVLADLNVEEGATNDSNIYYPGTTYINGGYVYAGSKIVIGDDNIILDGDPNGAGTPGSGSVIVAPDGGPTNQSYCELQDGDLSFYRVFSDGLQYKYKSVVSIDSGECVNNQTIRLNGRWKERPYVQVAPAELMSYDKSYSTYSQTLSCPAPTPWESPIGSGQWYIKPRAVLKMSPNVTTVGYNHAVEKEYTPPETEGSRGPYWSGWHSLGSYSFQRNYAYKYVINLTASHRIEVNYNDNFEGACLHLQYSYDNATWVDLFYYNSGPPYHNSFRTWSQNYNLTKTGPASHTMKIYFRGRGIRNWEGSGTYCRWLMKIKTNNIKVYTTTYDTGAIDGTLTYLAIGK